RAADAGIERAVEERGHGLGCPYLFVVQCRDARVNRHQPIERLAVREILFQQSKLALAQVGQGVMRLDRLVHLLDALQHEVDRIGEPRNLAGEHTLADRVEVALLAEKLRAVRSDASLPPPTEAARLAPELRQIILAIAVKD